MASRLPRLAGVARPRVVPTLGLPSVLQRLWLVPPRLPTSVRLFASSAGLREVPNASMSAAAPTHAAFASDPVPKPLRDYGEQSDTAREEILQSVLQFAEMPQTPVALADLQRYGTQPAHLKGETVRTAATFLHRELPIRLAHRIAELNSLPYGLNDAEGIQRVRDWYIRSFKELVTSPVPSTDDKEELFAETIERIYERHAPTLYTMSSSLLELHQRYADPKTGLVPTVVEDTVSPFLDSFYSSRIGIRTLIQQHLAMRRPDVDGWSGVIQTCMSPVDVAKQAINDATVICERTLGDAPDTQIIAPAGLTFPYIPSYFHHMLFELVKNSMRAVMERHGDSNDIPSILIVISGENGNEDVVVKVSDQGGGIPRSEVDRVWKYLYTTATPAHLPQGEVRDFGTNGPLAGLGYGLPLSRLYARYWGGELQLISMEGYGTDAYLHLRLDGDTKEKVDTAGAGFWRAAAKAFSKHQHPSHGSM